MKFLTVAIMILLISVFFFSCSTSSVENPDELIVAVGVVPQATFVDKVSMGSVKTVILIPPGNSPANYQPSSREMQELSDADIYFTLQMPAEEANILPKILDFNKDIVIVNQRDIVSEKYPLIPVDDNDHNTSDSNHNLLFDPHIWLSPKRAKVMVQNIAHELSLIDPDNKSFYQKNAEQYISQIDLLDKKITKSLSALNRRAFMIYHGSYGYFAKDYNLNMVSIEVAGKQATAVEIQKVIEYANTSGIKIIFYQEEFDDSQAQTIADEINGKVIQVSPLSENYIQSLWDFVNALVHQED